MPATGHWFSRLGFEVWQVAGVSRAWRYDFLDGSYLLVTDLGGYDLPEPGGPYSAMFLTAVNELLELHPCLPTTKDLLRCFNHISRLIARQAHLDQVRTD